MAALSYLLACLEGEAAKGWVEPMVIIRSLAFALAFSTRFYGGMVMKTLMVPRPLPLASCPCEHEGLPGEARREAGREALPAAHRGARERCALAE